MGVTDPPLPEPVGGSRGLAAPLNASWGSEVDLTEASQPLELTQPDPLEASLFGRARWSRERLFRVGRGINQPRL